MMKYSAFLLVVFYIGITLSESEATPGEDAIESSNEGDNVFEEISSDDDDDEELFEELDSKESNSHEKTPSLENQLSKSTNTPTMIIDEINKPGIGDDKAAEERRRRSRSEQDDKVEGHEEHSVKDSPLTTSASANYFKMSESVSSVSASKLLPTIEKITSRLSEVVTKEVEQDEEVLNDQTGTDKEDSEFYAKDEQDEFEGGDEGVKKTVEKLSEVKASANPLKRSESASRESASKILPTIEMITPSLSAANLKKEEQVEEVTNDQTGTEEEDLDIYANYEEDESEDDDDEDDKKSVEKPPAMKPESQKESAPMVPVNDSLPKKQSSLPRNTDFTIPTMSLLPDITKVPAKRLNASTAPPKAAVNSLKKSSSGVSAPSKARTGNSAPRRSSSTSPAPIRKNPPSRNPQPKARASRSAASKPVATAAKKVTPVLQKNSPSLRSAPVKAVNISQKPKRQVGNTRRPVQASKSAPPTRKLDPEVMRKVTQLKKNVDALTPVSVLTALSKTPSRQLNTVSPDLDSIIDDFRGTPMQKYFKSVKLLINSANKSKR